MSSFSPLKVLDYEVTFRRCSRGKSHVSERDFALLLRKIGFCDEPTSAAAAARELIEKYDFSLKGQLDFEDFLEAMEDIECKVEELRKHFEDSLRYFCIRKLEQNANSPFGIVDILCFLQEMSPDHVATLMEDLQKEIAAYFFLSNPSSSETGMPSEALGDMDGGTSSAKYRTSSNKYRSTMASNELEGLAKASLRGGNEGNGAGQGIFNGDNSVQGKFGLDKSGNPKQSSNDHHEMDNAGVTVSKKGNKIVDHNDLDSGSTEGGMRKSFQTGNEIESKAYSSKRNATTLLQAAASPLKLFGGVSMLGAGMPFHPAQPILPGQPAGQHAGFPGLGVQNMFFDGSMSVPESALVDILVNMLFPKPKELVMYEQIHGHRTQEITVGNFGVRNLSGMMKPKMLPDKCLLELEAVNPVFVVSCQDCVVHSEVIQDYAHAEDTTEMLTVRIELPSLRSEEVAEWIDKSEIVISVFDNMTHGVAPWVEWLGTTRRRLSWLLDRARDGAAVTCSMELHSLRPRGDPTDCPRVECSIALPPSLVALWQTFRARKGYPRWPVILQSVKAALENAPYEECFVTDENEEKLLNFELFNYWKKRRAHVRHFFPRRNIRFLAKDDYGTVHLLPCFIRRYPSVGSDSVGSILAAVAALESGMLPHCDLAQSAFNLDTVLPTAVTLMSRRASSLELAILLCSCMLGLGKQAYVAIGDGEIAWVLVIEQRPDASAAEGDAKKQEHRRSVLLGSSKVNQRLNRAKFRRRAENKLCELDRLRVKLCFWNPSLGVAFDEDHPRAPKRINFVFNDANVWYNTHRSTLVSRSSWETLLPGERRDNSKWEAFLTPEVAGMLGPLRRTYSQPDFGHYQCLTLRSPDLEGRIFLSDLVDAISIFRQHKIYAPDTMFDTKLCAMMHERMSDMIDRIDTPHDELTSTALMTALREEFQISNDAQIPPCLIDALPPGFMMTSGAFYFFHSVDIQDVMLKLQETGILNHTHPKVRYVASANLIAHLWDLSTVVVFLGTAVELEATLTSSG
ncbi:Coiled-coil and C2 domain-containing protein 2A [Durusdinium trenchii]|uniref:Coiled-coil and C2 domain-containing protein 2A n=1 Tax=Durusdinium trenchii TaxID=1381693 RepID=A0ABP0S3Z5_9DINO